MHEISITQSLLNLILEKTPSQSQVTDVYLRVGEMSCVSSDTVEIYFKHLSQNSPAANAKLHFEMEPLQLTCRDCQRQWSFARDEKNEHAPQILRRAFAIGCECGGKNLKICGGMGSELVRFEVKPISTSADLEIL